METLDDLIPGQEYVRRELHKIFGGNRQKGIVTLPKFDAIFLLNSSKGSDYGYSDSWSKGLYTLSGEGTIGNQKLTAGNKALADAIGNLKRVFLFEPMVNRKPFTHIFESELRCVDYKEEEGKDLNGNTRTMFRFFFKSLNHPDFRASLLQQLREEIESDLSGNTEHPRRTQKVIDRGSKPLSWYRETFIRDGYKCVYCDKDVKSQFDDWMSIEVDHIIPVAKGGSHNLGNRGTSCNVCNSLKHSYSPENFESMSREELLADIRKYIRGKREIWGARYQEALEEYKQKR
jgi:hypothetical protein